MSKLSATGFASAAKDALDTMHRTGRAGEPVLAWAIQKNLTPTVAQHGDLRGKKVVLARVCRIASYVRDDKGVARVQFALSDALNRTQTEEQWIELAELSRIRERSRDTIGVFPPAVEDYLCGSENAEIVAKARDWFFRLFGALSRLSNTEWAAAAAKERDRMARVFRVQEAQELQIAA